MFYYMNRNLIISGIAIIVLASGLFGIIVTQVMGEDIDTVETDEEWEISNNPLIEGDVTLDGYGDEDNEITYVYAEHEEGLELYDYKLIEEDGEYVIEVEGTVNESSDKGEILKATVTHFDVKDIRLNVDGDSYSTDVCGCVIGDYSN